MTSLYFLISNVFKFHSLYICRFRDFQLTANQPLQPKTVWRKHSSASERDFLLGTYTWPTSCTSVLVSFFKLWYSSLMHSDT